MDLTINDQLTDALAIKSQSQRLMTKGARTLYYDNNIILIITEEAANVSIDDTLSNFSYELEPRNFCGSPAV